MMMIMVIAFAVLVFGMVGTAVSFFLVLVRGNGNYGGDGWK